MARVTPLLICVVSLVLADVSTGADLYVSPEGNDLWSGSLQTPNAALTDGPLASLVARGMRFGESRRPEGCSSRFVCELAAASMPYPNRWSSSRRTQVRNAARSATAAT